MEFAGTLGMDLFTVHGDAHQLSKIQGNEMVWRVDVEVIVEDIYIRRLTQQFISIGDRLMWLRTSLHVSGCEVLVLRLGKLDLLFGYYLL